MGKRSWKKRLAKKRSENTQLGHSILVREGVRQICWQGCEDWDRLTMFAVLSSDPRSIEELEHAWTRYRREPALLELPWQSVESQPATDANWLWIDLTHQCYSWDKPKEIRSLRAAYQRDEGQRRPGDPLVWLNPPNWWRAVSASQWPGPTQRRAIDALRAIDFRYVLYGRGFLEDIAERVCSQDWQGKRPRHRDLVHPDELKMEAEALADLDSNFDFSAIDVTPDELEASAEWHAAVKAIHVQWLMTPRKDLCERSPRTFLHLDRAWKDRELEFRRAQWSRLRQAPAAVPRWSHLFLKGPMGTEEVVCYFELCREVITAAWRLVDDDPTITHNTLVDELEEFLSGWLDTLLPDSGGLTPRQIIDGERTLMPRLASGDPFDCDCPLCRIQAHESEMFGPAFSVADGCHMEMEDEFAFSLQDDRKVWEEVRDEWLSWDDSPTDRSGPWNVSRGNGTDSGPDREADWSDTWQTSYVNLSITSPSLSLLGIGARLSEIIDSLKTRGADPAEVTQTNEAFDELARVVGEWLLADSARGDAEHELSTEKAAQRMIEMLEGVAVRYPELINKSADLQSLVHQWQRQLTVQPGS